MAADRPRRVRPRTWIMLVLLIGLLLGSTLPLRAQAIEPVFGLRGMLEPVDGQPFANVLVDPSGRRYGIAGATPAIEQEISALAARREVVKVWGTLQAQNPLSETPLIVATEIVDEPGAPLSTPAMPPAPRASPTPLPPMATRPPDLPVPTTAPVLISAPTATITVYAAYVRAGPGSDYPTIGQVSQATVCAVAARATAGGWLKLQCPGILGWVREGLYTVSGSVTTAPLETGPTPTPLPPTPATGLWRGFGYANRTLSDTPVALFESPEINYDWGTASPHPLLPADNFSLRFDRTLRFTPGLYQIALTYDDGIRFAVDGQLVLTDWAEGGMRTRTWQGALGGDVGLRLDYFDAYGPAILRLAIMPLQTAAPTTTPIPPLIPAQPPVNAWLATYYDNPTLTGPVLFARTEPRGGAFPLHYEFSLASPVPGIIGEDNWSARWRGRFIFDSADYRFLARGNTGVRVYIDGIRVINAWPNTTDTVSNLFRRVGGGEHEITVEMFDSGGLAWVRTWWERQASESGDREP